MTGPSWIAPTALSSPVIRSKWPWKNPVIRLHSASGLSITWIRFIVLVGWWLFRKDALLNGAVTPHVAKPARRSLTDSGALASSCWIISCVVMVVSRLGYPVSSLGCAGARGEDHDVQQRPLSRVSRSEPNAYLTSLRRGALLRRVANGTVDMELSLLASSSRHSAASALVAGLL